MGNNKMGYRFDVWCPLNPSCLIGFWGIKSMLEQLGNENGLQCNPHTFRRTFACLLRKAGIDTMTIKDLGRWESLEMVQRYTRSVTFQDSLKFYKAPLSWFHSRNTHCTVKIIFSVLL